MSGIAGILSFDKSVQTSVLIKRLISGLAHRGPDGMNHWASGHVSMGCCLLRNTPQARAEKQPLVTRQQDLALVMDGRLDNRNELFEQLKPDFPRDLAPDSAFVLAAYLCWGEDCPRYLLGDFAFVIWDARRQKMFCARDRMGAAGFSFHYGKHFFAFATGSEALLSLPGVNNTPNKNYIACIFVPEFENRGDRHSWYQDVKGLLPGESLSVDIDGELRIQRYCDFEPMDDRRYASYGESEEHFLSVFGRAVGDRMRNPGDIAIMMSGGLDSAGIVAMTHRLMYESPGKRLHSYSAIDDVSASCIESRCIESLAENLGTVKHTVSVPSFQGMVSVDDLREVAWANAQPVFNSILLPALMCLAASRDGQKVLLHGASGDIAMRAPNYYPYALLQKGDFLSAWHESQAASKNNYYLQEQSPISIFLRSILFATVPPAVQAWRRRKQYEKQISPMENSLINPEFARSIHLHEQLEEEFYSKQKAAREDARRYQMQQALAVVCSGLSGYNSVAGRFGMEARDPWADSRVLDFFFRLPVENKVRNGWTKFPVRSAFKDELPTIVRQRHDKRHLGWKFTYRLLEESKDLVRDTMETGLYLVEDFVDVKSVQAVFQRFCTHGDHASKQAVFDLLTLNLWLQRIKTL